MSTSPDNNPPASSATSDTNVAATIENPRLKSALTAHLAAPSEPTLTAVVMELNRAFYLLPLHASETSGNLNLSEGSETEVNVMICRGEDGRTLLPLFTDLEELQAWTDQPVTPLALPARDAWGFADTANGYVGVVVNPSGDGFILEPQHLDWLKANPAQG